VRLILLSLSHRNAAVELRERLAFSEEERRLFMQQLVGHPDVEEALLLNTCNRTELLVRHAPLEQSHLAALPQMLHHHLVEFRARQTLVGNLAATVGKENNIADNLYSEQWELFADEDAARHLMEVAAGLHSMILGEAQILAQVRDAYRICCAAGANGFFLNRLMHQVLRAGKRVRAETEIGLGAVSVGQAAVDLMTRELGSLKGKAAVVVGAGEMAEQVLRRLGDMGLRRVVVMNRTQTRAAALAQAFGVEHAPLAQMTEQLQQADFALLAVAGNEPLLGTQHARLWEQRPLPLRLVDISVPRAVHAEVGQLPGCKLFNIDHLKGLVDRNLALRQAQQPMAHQIVTQTLAELREWYLSLEVVPLIQEIYRRLEAVRQQELDRVRPQLEPQACDLVDEVTRRLMRKLLHGPVSAIRQHAVVRKANSQFWAKWLQDAFPSAETQVNQPSQESHAL